MQLLHVQVCGIQQISGAGGRGELRCGCEIQRWVQSPLSRYGGPEGHALAWFGGGAAEPGGKEGAQKPVLGHCDTWGGIEGGPGEDSEEESGPGGEASRAGH